MTVPNDLTYKNDNGVFNYRVGAIIIRENKLLMVKNDKSPYYYSVGGRVKFCETAEEAVIREVFEETGINAQIDHLGFVHQNFFKIKDYVYHELAFFYYIKSVPEFDSICLEFDEGGSTEHLHWIDLDNIEKEYLYPEFFKSELKNRSDTVKMITTNQLIERN